MIPPWDHTGTFHFHSSTTPESASRMSARSRASISPRQSGYSAILESIIVEGVPPWGITLFFMGPGLRLFASAQVARRRRDIGGRGGLGLAAVYESRGAVIVLPLGDREGL